MEEKNNVEEYIIMDEIDSNEQAIEYQEPEDINLAENELEEKAIQEELEEIILGEEICEDLDENKIESLNKNDLSNKSEEELVAYYNNIKCDRVVGVYVKVNANGYITDVTNDMFTKNLDGFVKIDEGDGDKFVHAETSYFEDSIIDEFGNYRYKLPNK